MNLLWRFLGLGNQDRPCDLSSVRIIWSVVSLPPRMSASFLTFCPLFWYDYGGFETGQGESRSTTETLRRIKLSPIHEFACTAYLTFWRGTSCLRASEMGFPRKSVPTVEYIPAGCMKRNYNCMMGTLTWLKVREFLGAALGGSSDACLIR